MKKTSECPACGCGQKRSAREVHYWECDRCKSWWKKKDGQITYGRKYHNRGQSGWKLLLAQKLGEWDRLRTLGPIEGKLVLEVGYGNGEMLRAMASKGVRVWGYEKSVAVKQLEVSERIKIVRSVEEVGLDSMDMVVAYHVLEHVKKPDKWLNEVKMLIRPGGRLIVRVPRIDSWEARVAGKSWYHIDYPYHEVLYSKLGLQTLFDRSGLEKVVIRQRLAEYFQSGGYSLGGKLWWLALPFGLLLSLIWGGGVMEAEATVMTEAEKC